MVIAHIADYRKDYLIPEFKPKAIENFFKIELLTSVKIFLLNFKDIDTKEEL